MVEAARKHNRVVQVGTQRRSAEHVLAAPRSSCRSGKLGKVPFARAWIAGNRPVDRQEGGRPGAEGGGLRPVARAGPGAAVQPEPLPLQLALVLGLRHRRAGQQRHPRPRRGPVRARPRRPDPRHRLRRQVLLRRRPGDAGHADRRRSTSPAARSSGSTASGRRPGWKASRSASRCTARRGRWSSTRRAGTSRTASRRRTRRPAGSRRRTSRTSSTASATARRPTPTSRRGTRAPGCATSATSPSGSAGR